jgi:hypothetical protein
MAQQKYMIHPGFIIGVISFILLFLGIGLKSNRMFEGNHILIASIVLGGIHWIWSLIDVIKDDSLKHDGRSRYFWISLVIMVPPVMGMVYYMMRRKRISF